MKFILAALVGATSAFPANDAFHCHCQLKTTITGNCNDTYTALDKTIKTLVDPGKGVYAILEESPNQWIWSTRTTPKHSYVDDQLFETQSGTDTTCDVVSKTRSRTLSYYDYNTNYCNLYNVFRLSNLTFTEPVVENCRWQPSLDTRAAACDKY